MGRVSGMYCTIFVWQALKLPSEGNVSMLVTLALFSMCYQCSSVSAKSHATRIISGYWGAK